MINSKSYENPIWIHAHLYPLGFDVFQIIFLIWYSKIQCGSEIRTFKIQSFEDEIQMTSFLRVDILSLPCEYQTIQNLDVFVWNSINFWQNVGYLSGFQMVGLTVFILLAFNLKFFCLLIKNVFVNTVGARNQNMFQFWMVFKQQMFRSLNHFPSVCSRFWFQVSRGFSFLWRRKPLNLRTSSKLVELTLKMQLQSPSVKSSVATQPKLNLVIRTSKLGSTDISGIHF